nr:AMP-binding protein [uncultured Methylophaga sp.]
MTIPYSLFSWWQGNDDVVIAIDGDRKRDRAELKRRVNAWIASIKEHEGQCWAVYHSDAFECLAIMLALWQLERTVCLSADNLPATVARLQHHVDGFVGEFEQNTFPQPSDEEQEVWQWQKASTDLIALQVFTSGSQGQPKRIDKFLQALDREIAALDCLSCEDVEVVLATVTHQHMYGVIFRLLRPFCYQQAFSAKLHEYPEELIRSASLYERFCLISSPAHLARMNAEQDWNLVKNNCVEVYSSAAPLTRTESMNVSAYLDVRVKEIYGSTETGAIAWRCQQDTEHDALWHKLSHVQLKAVETGGLEVRFVQGGNSYVLADHIEFDPQGDFALLGRHDPIVKVEGKRLSLTELTNAVTEHPWIDEARAILLSRKRTETAVVAVLSESGQQQLITQGRKALIKSMKHSLADQFEPVLLPRRWRFIEAMPVNTQGKLTMNALTALFDKPDTVWPIIEAETVSEQAADFSCRIPEELLYFDGHFQQQAILPGVVQLHWAAKLGQKYLNISGHFHRLEAIKFQQLILPGSVVSLSLSYDHSKQKLSFSFSSEKGVHSSGKVCYA